MCSLTHKEAKLLVTAMSMTEKLSNESWDNILKIIDCHLPCPYYKSKHNILKNIELDSIVEYSYCAFCERIFKFEEIADTFVCECGKQIVKEDLKKKHQTFFHIPLKQQLMKLLNSPIYDYLRQETDDSYVVSGQAYQKLKLLKKILPNDLSIQWNTDGLALVKRSKAAAWPIIVGVNELPYKMRRNNLFLCGLWFRYDSKIPTNVFLKPFVNELSDLSISGFESTTYRSIESIHIRVHTLLAAVDAPARCKCQNIKQFNGKFGCPYCLHPGEVLEPGKNNARIYRGAVGNPRTTAQHVADVKKVVDNGEYVHGIKGPSICSKIPLFNIIYGFPPEYMHCAILGVVESFLNQWFDSKYHENEWSLSNKKK